MQPLVHRATERCGDMTTEQVCGGLCSGDMLAWVAVLGPDIMGLAVTALSRRRGRTVCTVILCSGGEMKRWLAPLCAAIEKYARAECCSVVRVEGRRGWKRRLPDFTEPYVVLEKRLD